jgi:hypothetical protein
MFEIAGQLNSEERRIIIAAIVSLQLAEPHPAQRVSPVPAIADFARASRLTMAPVSGCQMKGTMYSGHRACHLHRVGWRLRKAIQIDF